MVGNEILGLDVFEPVELTPAQDDTVYPTPEEVESEVPLAFIRANLLTNIYTPKAIYLWFRLLGDAPDFTLESCEHDGIGVPPKWYVNDDCFDPGATIDPEYHYVKYRGEEFNLKWYTWALTYGIAPGQPFLVRFDEPRWYKCGEYGEEWDSEQDTEIVYVVPNHLKRALKIWDRTLKRVHQFQDNRVEVRLRARRLQIEDISALGLEIVRHHVGPCYWDDMGDNRNNDGVTVRLTSKHNDSMYDGYSDQNPACLVYGSSDKGDPVEAFKRMLDKAVKMGVDPTAIVALAGGKIPLDRWKRISLPSVV
jgi:hypothetical protein